ncbi:MAG: DUF4430 domain-containing protein [Candidatus Wildermuthbacteria bacterium]|nr:DUF4430 domain-containing protein [Candidatus Wildermuthbacteria bacterium]
MKKILPYFGIAIVAGVIVFGVQGGRTNEFINQDVLSISAVLDVEGKRYEISLSQGSTVHELMLAAKGQYDFQFSGREFPGMGFFIEEINGLGQNSRAGKYWIYYINGRKAEVGISTYIVQKNDVISWKYEDEE